MHGRTMLQTMSSRNILECWNAEKEGGGRNEQIPIYFSQIHVYYSLNDIMHNEYHDYP